MSYEVLVLFEVLFYEACKYDLESNPAALDLPPVNRVSSTDSPKAILERNAWSKT